MINDYKIKKINDQEVLYLYLDYSFEFGNMNDIDNKFNIIGKIKNYIKDRKIQFNGKYIMLVVGAITVMTLTCNFGKLNQKENAFVPNPEIIELLKYNTFPEKPQNKELNNTDFYNYYQRNNKDEKINEQIEIDDQEQNENSNNTNVTKEINVNENKNDTANEKTNNVQYNVISSNNDKEKNNSQTTNQNTNITENKNDQIIVQDEKQSQTQTETPTETQIEEKNSSDIMVTIYRSNGTTLTIELEEYLIGVVASEMPTSFNIEALKAQAVVARTYTLKKIDQNQVLTDTTSTQVYKDNEQLKTMWGSDYNKYYNKIKQVVNDTNGTYISYNNQYIDAVYHSTSNGYTVDASTIWGNDIPYLKSVSSIWDKDASSYLRTTTFNLDEINTLLNLTINTNINIVRDSNNRVINVIIGTQTFTGVEFRNLLGLRSTDFDIEINDNIVTITTRGYGHGVGMSQYGANGMANAGYSYSDILHHYYTNIQIKKLS